ncbi:helix-turn-helix domain-containing protein [Cerasicoccus fimbriatus]|uniref:helix-turn-helix domain-containing protein n=1 Tax=Cerasicoccus fimbriatus TaxID=3014554 RepID=UPI0022B43D52|nr:helix-turn-helix domain-containing protein [Cerasicoccus sp. TK19100]
MSRTPDIHTNIQLIGPGAMERGTGYTTWRPEGSGDWLLIYSRSGRGYCETHDGRRILLNPGSVALWELGAYQSYGTDAAHGTWNIIWAHFNPRAHWRPWLAWAERARGVRIFELTPVHRPAVDEAMETTIRLGRSGLPLAPELAMNALERAVLEIHNAYSELPGSGMDPRIRSVVEWLATLPREDFDSDSLARRCGLSASRFAHVFREQTGTTPQRMLESNRLRVAAELLRNTRLDVQEVAHEVGYEDAFYFSRRFKMAHKKSPSDYRGG